MNHEKITQLILLRQSGEISPEALQSLEQALASDPAAAELATDFDALLFKSSQLQVDDAPLSEVSLERICQFGAHAHRAETTPSYAWLKIAAVFVVLLSLASISYMMNQFRANTLAGTTVQPAVNPTHAAEPASESFAVAALAATEVDEQLKSFDQELSTVNESLFGDDFWGEEETTAFAGSDIDLIAAELLAYEERI